MQLVIHIIRTLYIVFCVLILTVVMGILAIVASLLFGKESLAHEVARAWGKAILWISRIQVRVSGMEHLKPGDSYIYMPNHQSYFDIPILLAHLPGQFRWLAKSELFKVPIFGPAMRRAGYISIDRSNRRSAFLSIDRAVGTIRNGASVVIFPEGTRSLNGQVGSFKKGGFVLAMNAEVPIVPVGIWGTGAIFPRNSFLIKPRPVAVQIMPPIHTAGYSYETKEALQETVKRSLCEAVNVCR